MDTEMIRNSIFINPTEQYVSSIGNNYISKFLAGGLVEKGFAILSDKRVYFRGTCYQRIGSKLHKKDVQHITDVKDVTGTEFEHRKNILLLALGIISVVVICMLLFIVTAFATTNSADLIIGGSGESNIVGGAPAVTAATAPMAEATIAYPENSNNGIFPALLIYSIPIPILFFIFYKRSKRTLFSINYAGGCIAFDTHWLNMNEVNQFQRDIINLKDSKQ